MYKKGNHLAWTGFALVVTYAFVSVFGGLTAGGTPLLPSLQPFVPFAALLDIIGTVLMFWGAILALKSKNRSLWWLLLFLLALSGAGVVFVAIIFMLKDKSVPVTPAVVVPAPTSNTPSAS